jgi:hypothetical protein
MKKSVIVSLIVFVILISISTTALAQSENRIVIYPWKIIDDEIVVSPNDYVVLGARYGACSRGLTNAGTRQANIYYELDGEILVSSQKDARRYWSEPELKNVYPFDFPCVQGPTDTQWWAFWEYEVGTMAVGDHTVHFQYWFDRPVHDGVDWDGDGEPDHQIISIVKVLTIHVEVP